jgi:hypothetical protein
MQTGTGNPPEHMMGLFVQANYQFSSSAPGRPSTFYFEDQQGNRGRFRRQHAKGPELAHQGACTRVFISPALELRLSTMAELVSGRPFSDGAGRFIWDVDDELFNTERYNKFTRIHSILLRGDPDHLYGGEASLNLQAGWRLFDTNDLMCHFSAGVIILNDPAAAQFFGQQNGDQLLAAYSGQWMIW